MKIRGILLVLIASLLVILGSVGGYYYYSAQPNKSTISTENQSVAPLPIKPQIVRVTLPGTSPIDALVDDYAQPSSLWVVVNKERPLTDQQYRPVDLIELTSVKTRSEKTVDERSLRAVVVSNLEALFADGLVAGYDFMLGSGFRSYDKQVFYYSNYVAMSGEAAANKYSAKPGYSEHQTGLAFDISLATKECYLEICFGDLDAGKWVAQNAKKYGFVVRYPADKVDITGYQYEPWHLRYVGRPLAEALTESQLTLDEALPYLEKARLELIETKKITVQ